MTRHGTRLLTCIVVAAIGLPGCVTTRQDSPTAQPVPVKPVAPPATVEAPPPVSPPPTGASGAGNPPFYEVYGERYFVLPSSQGYAATGIASWYGKDFHGKRTSSGAIYDMHELTAAHKTLPLPSLVRVTNLDNGRSVVVTVNDRGPFVKDRLIDLSYAAANELGIVQAGTGRVEVQALAGLSGAGPVVVKGTGSGPGAPGTSVAPTLVPAQQMYMQVGAFSDAGNADRLKAQLESNGLPDVVIRRDSSVSPVLYRVRIGPIADSSAYDRLASRVESLRLGNPRLVTEAPDTVSYSRPGG
jgi:rare lipoprotein A